MTIVTLGLAIPINAKKGMTNGNPFFVIHKVSFWPVFEFVGQWSDKSPNKKPYHTDNQRW
jgi:hypothetical protein